MPVDELIQYVQPACEEVLETMFFTSVLESSPEAGEGPDWEAVFISRLMFSGTPSGMFQLRIGLSAARSLAAGFLGEFEEDVSVAQAGDVVCELANMLCGTVLSRLSRTAAFVLSHPELAGEWDNNVGVRCHLELPEGALDVGMHLREPQ